MFLEPFVEILNVLGDKGVKCAIKTEKPSIKIFCLVCCVDSVARAPMLCMVLFNGKFECPWCNHSTEWVVDEKKLNSVCTKYPRVNIQTLFRTEEESILHIKMDTKNKPCYKRAS